MLLILIIQDVLKLLLFNHKYWKKAKVHINLIENKYLRDLLKDNL